MMIKCRSVKYAVLMKQMAEYQFKAVKAKIYRKVNMIEKWASRRLSPKEATALASLPVVKVRVSRSRR